MKEKIERVETAIEYFKACKPVLLCDHADRENEGDVIIPAELATPEVIQFMAQQACGLICLPLDRQYIEKFHLPPMSADNKSKHRTAFTVSIGSREGVTTGISAHDRSHTVKTVISDASKPDDIVTPGHVFPLAVKEGGVFARQGHTEGSVDLAKLAGFKPAAVICEVMGRDGHMAKGDELMQFAKKHDLAVLYVDDIIHYRAIQESRVDFIAQSVLPTDDFGDFNVYAFTEKYSNTDHLAIVVGDPEKMNNPLVRVHSSCVTGDVFSSERCDCGDQLHAALHMIQSAGSGMVIYLQQEGRGIGLANKIKAYALQDQGMDTVEANHQLGFPADMRSFSSAADILKYLGVESVRLMTNNPKKVEALQDFGVQVIERVPVEIPANEKNKAYLTTKKTKLGHLLKKI